MRVVRPCRGVDSQCDRNGELLSRTRFAHAGKMGAVKTKEDVREETWLTFGPNGVHKMRSGKEEWWPAVKTTG